MVSQYKKQFDSMMQREINRGEFIKFMGIALLGVFGVVGFLKNLHEVAPSQTTHKKRVAHSGYGQSAYGQ